MCLLRGCAFGFDSRATGRANNCQTIAFEFAADNVRDLVGKFANGGAAIFLHHPVLPKVQGAAI